MVDFTAEANRNTTTVMTMIAGVVRKFKVNHPEVIVDVCFQYLVMRQECVLGTCRIFKGLKNAAVEKFAEETLDELLVPMGHSETVAAVQLAQAQSKVAKQLELVAVSTGSGSGASGPKPKAARGKGGAKPKASPKPKKGKPQEDVEAMGEADGSVAFIDYLTATQKYMQKIDTNGDLAECITAFKHVGINGALNGGVELTLPPGNKFVKGFKLLTKTWKSALYRYARLQPRPSDIDFADGDDLELSMLDGGQDMRQTVGLTAESVAHEMEEYEDVVGAIISCIEAAPVDVPIIMHQGAAACLNQTMMATFGVIKKEGGVLGSIKEAAKLLIEQCFGQVEALMPAEWDKVARLFDRIAQSDNAKELVGILYRSLGYKKLYEYGFGGKLLRAFRLRVLVHVLTSIGTQTYLLQQGPVQREQEYIPPVVLQIFKTLDSKVKVQNDYTVELGVFGEYLEKANTSLQEGFMTFFDTCFWAHNHCLSNDVAKYKRERDGLNVKLQQATHAGFLKLAGEHVKACAEYKVDPGLDVFPSEKAKAMCKEKHGQLRPSR